VIDLHIHILAGLDDGPQTLDDCVELARQAAAEGVRTVVATPHVRADYPTTAEQMERGVSELTARLDVACVTLDVQRGGELDAAWLSRLEPDELLRFSLAQRGRYALLEFPYSGWPAAFDAALATLHRHGLVAVLAHPERNDVVQRDPRLLEDLVAAGAVVQVTAASLDGRLGRAAQSAARRLLDLRLAHVLASDAHGPGRRGAALADAVDAVRDEALARFLTVDAPAAILAGEPLGLPPRSRRHRLDDLRSRLRR
jgi:protein-tyrosine phosphatase